MKLYNNWLTNKYIAHRGLHNDEYPENSIPAFLNAVNNGYAIELDVQLISDGNVVVFHDETLARMSNCDGYTKNLTLDTLKNCKLAKSEYTIPLFSEVLEAVNGQTPLLIEIKNNDSVGTLEEKVLELLKNYKGKYAIQSFNPYVIEWFMKNAPQIPRGLLSCKFKNTKLKFYQKIALRRLVFAKKVKANFISYDATALPNRYVKKHKNLPLLAWTIHDQMEYNKVMKYCDNIIFEGFEPEI